MNQGVRWPFLVVFALLLVGLLGKVGYVAYELHACPGLAYSDERQPMPFLLWPTRRAERHAAGAAAAAYRAWQAAPPTLAQRPGTPLTRQVDAALADHYGRRLVTAYDQRGHQGAAWDGLAHDLLKARGATLQGAVTPELAQAARRLLASPCDDPLVVGCALLAVDRWGDHAIAVAAAQQRSGKLARAAYQPADLFWFTLRPTSPPGTATSESAPLGLPGIDPRQVKLGSVQAARGPFAPGEQRLYLQTAGASLVADGLREVGEQTGTDPWIFHLLLARYLMRGGSPATTVADDEPTPARVRTQLLLAWRLHPDYPEAATELLQLQRWLKAGEAPRFWLDQAVAAQFDYTPAYDAMDQALARLDGSDARLAFAREAAATGRFDTTVPEALFPVLAGQLLAGRTGQSNPDRDYAELRAMFAQRLAAEPDAARTAARWAAAAWMVGNAADGVPAAHRAGNALNDTVLARFGRQSAGEIRLWAQACERYGEAYARGDRALREGRYGEAVTALAPLEGKLEDGSYAACRRFAAERMAAATLDTAVPVAPDGSLRGWWLESGERPATQDGALILDSDHPFKAVFAAPILPPFVVEAELAPLTGDPPGSFELVEGLGGTSSRWRNELWPRTGHEGVAQTVTITIGHDDWVASFKGQPFSSTSRIGDEEREFYPALLIDSRTSTLRGSHGRARLLRLTLRRLPAAPASDVGRAGGLAKRVGPGA